MIIVGEPGSGKTHFIVKRVEEALRPGGSGKALLVTPTSSMARHLAHQLARLGLAVPGDLVLPIGRLTERLTPDVEEPSATVDSWLHEEAVLQGGGAAFGELSGSPGLLRRVQSAIEELQAARCSPKQAEQLARTPQQRGLAAVYQTYQRFLDTYGLVSAAQRRILAAEQAALTGVAGVEQIYFDGFWDYSPVERDLICSLRNRGHKVVVAATPKAARHFYDWPCEDLPGKPRTAALRTVVGAPSVDQEVEEVARRIVTSNRPWREIAVVTRTPEIYRPAIEAVFTRFGIPFRMRSGRELASHSAAAFVCEILDAIGEGLPGATVLGALRRPASRLSQSAQFDRWDFELQERLPGEGMEFLLQGAPNAVRDALEPLARTAGWPKRRAAPQDWAADVWSLSSTLLARPTVGDGLAATEMLEFRTWGRAVAGVAQAAADAAKLFEFRRKSECSFERFVAAFKRSLGAATLLPADERRDVVNVLPVFEARQWELPMVFVCGMVEGQFPQNPAEDLFFAEADRKRMAKAGVALRMREERLENERQLFEIAETRASEALVLSYPEADSMGAPLLRSFFLSGAAEDDFKTKPTRPVEQPSQGPTPSPGRLEAPAALAALRANHLKFSPSGIDRFLQCPFQFFATNTLRLRERPGTLEKRLDPRAGGTVVHAALAEWGKGSTRSIREILSEVYAEILEKLHLRPGFRTAVIQAALAADLERFVTEDLSKPLPGSQHGEFEQEVSYLMEKSADGEVYVGGRLDRYDTVTGGMALVIDYKHSAADRLKKLVAGHEKGTNLQGFLYVQGLAAKNGLKPAGMIFCTLKNETTAGGWVVKDVFPNDSIPSGVEAIDAARWEELLAEGVRAAAEAGKRIREGVIAVAPEDKGFCERLCAFSSVCRVELPR
jgi:ATP-dependent helicase/DNAse subunit B